MSKTHVGILATVKLAVRMSNAELRDATYEGLRSGFRWQVPADVNMGVLCCDRHPPESLALIAIGPDESVTRHTFGELARDSNRLANALAHRLGVLAGDRIGIVLSQRLETGLAHLAAYKLGAVAVPLSGLFGPEALRYRLSDCAARVLITDAEHLELVGAVADELDATVICVDGARSPHLGFWDLLGDASDRLAPRRCSSTRRAPPARRRAPCTGIGCCTATCRASISPTSSSGAPTISSGRRPTGLGSAG
jgi:hypothetical protein